MKLVRKSFDVIVTRSLSERRKDVVGYPAEVQMLSRARSLLLSEEWLMNVFRTERSWDAGDLPFIAPSHCFYTKRSPYSRG